MSIGLAVIGANPTNMGSTTSLLRDVPDLRYELRGVCAKNPVVLERYAHEIGSPFWTTDYRELVARDDVDVVAIYSPDHLHAEHCLAAIDAGKHVVCTKPMVADLDDAKRLVTRVRESGVKFLVGQTMRFDVQFATMRRFVEDGDLGEIMVAEAHYNHDLRAIYEMTPWRLNAPQDFMYGGVVHPVDILRCLVGDIDEVHAYASKGLLTPEYPQQNNFLLNLKFSNGAIGRAMGLYDVVHPPMPMMQVTLYGTKGTMVGEFTDNEGGSVRLTLDKTGVSQPLVMHCPPETDTSVYGHGQSVIRYMRHFQECLDTDTQPSPDVVDGAKSIAVGAAAWESVQTGAAVGVFNDFR
ncbi:MAG: Gfo/Idh/MocA family oxidoreductase [Candidatus Poribacteria bacterium]